MLPIFGATNIARSALDSVRPLSGDRQGIARFYLSQSRDNPDRSDDHVNHIINRPTCVALEETEVGVHKGLRIDAESGETTLLRFRSPALPETVDGAILR
jgi:hypothetical protein